MAFDMKIWSIDKLTSVLERCLPPEAVPSTSGPTAARNVQSSKERSLTRLLENERLHGTTERDPTQKRHDFVYFSKNCYFVLVEDMRQELQTLISLEYPISKSRDGKESGSWPVLYCDPRARGPFLPFDEREERRVEKAERAERDREADLLRRKAKLREQERRRKAQQEAQKKGDLRRTVSMQNMRRRLSLGDECPEGLDFNGDIECDPDSAAASGYLASGNYVAASGNSVGITSTTGTTSTTGLSLRSLQLPRNIAGKLSKEVVTNRRLSHIAPTVGKENAMGPPPTVPDRPQRLLRKSRSTNTMRLPKRDEGTKPGYCESCRVKFEDFQQVGNTLYASFKRVAYSPGS
jgi:regulatory subunit for Cdc7p protein kinase